MTLGEKVLLKLEMQQAPLLARCLFRQKMLPVEPWHLRCLAVAEAVEEEVVVDAMLERFQGLRRMTVQPHPPK